MKIHPAYSTLSLCFALTGTASALPQKSLPKQINLKTYRDKSRLWIVFAPSSEDKRARLQQKLWSKAERSTNLKERDLVTFTVFEKGKSMGDGERISERAAKRLRTKFRVPQGAFRAILIGKDGGEKYRATKPITSQMVFGMIDAMPMRKQEMRRQLKK